MQDIGTSSMLSKEKPVLTALSSLQGGLELYKEKKLI